MMSKTLNRCWALAIVGCLSACTPTDQQSNQSGYTVLDGTQRYSTAATGAVDVVEFFMYSCGHCYALETPLNAWSLERKAIHLERVPIAFSDRDVPLQRLYYAVQSLPDPERLHRAIFSAIHQKKMILDSETAMADYIVQLGIERDAFLAAYRDPVVQQQIDHALTLRHRYAIRAVPTMVVADRFLTSPAMLEGSSAAANTSQPIEHTTTLMLDYLLEKAERAVTPLPGESHDKP